MDLALILAGFFTFGITWIALFFLHKESEH